MSTKSRRTVRAAQMAIIFLLLTGCYGGPRSETIIIPDQEDGQQLVHDNEFFDVKTIYKVLEGQLDSGKALGWIDSEALVVLFGEQSRTPSLERVDLPYEKRLKLRNVDELPDMTTVSPNGQYMSSIVEANGTFQLVLISLTDNEETVIHTLTIEQIRWIRLGWSANSRFFSYVLGIPGETDEYIVVYDVTDGKTKQYSMPERNVSWPIVHETPESSSVYIADDGLSAAIIKESSGQTQLEYGTLAEEGFAIQLEHPASLTTRVEWMNNDQIIFVGPEGNLYGYDRRNAALTVLQKQVGTFCLSQDRKFIAYTQDGNTVYAAVLYGNNLVNQRPVYRGIDAAQLVWSLDNRKLLIEGWKPYERERSHPVPMPAPVIPPGNQTFVIAFD